ncbi:uncharacterized protein B0I36DRAFT_388036 [Microdochium trichocladiopsis]|uniref:Uncharacterized protein n=1 Tax=Microdochium trichocladiopsis TaxID=1682393 RepID=A0A9P9BKJ3_9PEZI|nr:uncharacterized protein B0I36DRAFT_388036 [Microdochium trichocladiopsis]KAH7021299.1 hypothetical protein B0I36DRAFT_388036 [Microdochium trichocladiopsis]
MVRISTLFLTGAAAFTPLASAAFCTQDREWCGSHLLDIGDYSQRVIGALTAYGLPTTIPYQNNTLFSCVNSNGGIAVLTYCGDGDTCYVSNRWGDGCPS